MKVSGAETVNLDRATLTVLRAEETAYIQVKSKQLNEQGKHVINIVHGTLQQGSTGYRKTLTFLWEADDEDPAYRKYLYYEKCKQIREKYQKKCEDAKKDSKSREQRFRGNITITEGKISQLEMVKFEGSGKVVAKNAWGNAGRAIGLLLFTIFFFAVGGGYFESLFLVIMGFFTMFGAIGFIVELIGNIKNSKTEKQSLQEQADELDHGGREKLMREIERNRKWIRDLPKVLEKQLARYKEEMEQELADAKAAIADIED